MSTTSQRIQEGLELRGLKQADLVEKTGISKGALSSYISGRYTPKQNNIYLIAKALDVNEAWLMGADVPMERVSTKMDAVQTSVCSVQCRDLLKVCAQLSVCNQDKVLAYSKALLSTQQMENDLLAAHARTDVSSNPVEIRVRPLTPSTLAAHFDGEEYTDDEMNEIRHFSESVKNDKVENK